MADPPFLDAPRPEELAQADVLESVEFFRPKDSSYRDTVWRPGMVISHSCDFTKFKADEEKGREGLDRFPLLVAPVIADAEIADRGTAGHARSGRVPRYFHIPTGDDDALPEGGHFVDFWFIQPMAVFELLDIRRLASSTDEWQKRLQRALDRFFSSEDRKKPPEEA